MFAVSPSPRHRAKTLPLFAMSAVSARTSVYYGRSQGHRSEPTHEQYEFCIHSYSLAYALNTVKRGQSRYFPSATENLAATVKPVQHNLETSRDRSDFRCAAIRSAVKLR